MAEQFWGWRKMGVVGFIVVKAQLGLGSRLSETQPTATCTRDCNLQLESHGKPGNFNLCLNLAALTQRTEILQFWVFFVALSTLVFVSHNPPLWESGAWLTGLQNQIQGPPLLRPCLHKIPIVRLQRQFFWQYKFLGKKDPNWPFFGLSDKANAKVKVLRFWWEFPNWMFWELCHFPDPTPVTSD